ncbi:MAG: hypothetical protein R3C28_12225 [Pirellulaceae bacterium]
MKARRWTRYTLRSALLLILVCAVFFNWIRIRIEAGRRQKEAVAGLRDSGASVHYNYEFDAAGNVTKQGRPSAPKWLREAVGDDTLVKVEVVEHLGGDEDEMEAGLSRLPELDRLGRLYLGGSKVVDKQLVYIGQVGDLNELYLEYTQITNDGLAHLVSLSNLQVLGLRDPKITDDAIPHLRKLTSLTKLDVTGTKISDKGLDELRQALPECTILREY